MKQTPAFAFLVNFVFLDGLLYLFFVSLFLALSRNDIPSKEILSEKYFFYVSSPQSLEPRRPGHIVTSLALEGVSNVSESQFPYIPLVRKIVLPSKGRQYKIINYVSTRRADAVEQPRKDGLWSETSRREKIYKRCRLVRVEPFHAFELDENPDVARSHSSHDDLSKPCSSTKTFHVNGRFNYLKNSYNSLY